MNLDKNTIKQILDNAPDGSDPVKILDRLVEKGFTLEGVDMNQARARISPTQQPSMEQPRKGLFSGFAAETGEDLTQIGEGISTAAQRRGEAIAESSLARQKGEQGFLRTQLQKIGQGAGFVSDVIGEGVIGLGKAVLPEAAERAIGGVATSAARGVVGLEPVQGLINRYQEIQQTNPALARDIDSVLGFTQLGLDIGTAGLGGRGVSAVGRQVGKTTGQASRLGRRGVEEIQGALTGTSQETIEQAFTSAFRGGEDLKQFTEALRSQVTPEQIVTNVRNATERVATRRSADYKNNLQPIVNETVDTSNVKSVFENRLNEFNITVKNGQLDFSESALRTVPQATSKIQQAYNEVVALGDSANLGKVDTTRQALRELTFVGEDASANRANALIESSIDSVRKAGKQVDGYEDLLVKFADDSDFLNELQRSLSTGDKATIDTAYRKLATSLKTNNERRMNLIRELDDATGGFILGQISGQQLSEALPRGLFRQIAAGVAGTQIITGGLSSSLIPALVFASPKVTGEFVRALGIGARKADTIIKAIDSARKIIDLESIPIPPGALGSEILEEPLQEQKQ